MKKLILTEKTTSIKLLGVQSFSIYAEAFLDRQICETNRAMSNFNDVFNPRKS